MKTEDTIRVIGFVLTLILSFSFNGTARAEDKGENPTPTPAPTPSPEPTPTCCSTWEHTGFEGNILCCSGIQVFCA